MNKKIIVHFQTVDPILYSLLERYPSLKTIKKEKSPDYFKNLCREIIGQQLSGKVADVLFNRFEKLFTGRRVMPQSALKLSEEILRGTGMSWSKARFIRDLAEKILNKQIHLDMVDQLTDEDVVKELVKVKGIGPWTAEMFLMFTLAREDVFSYGDLGLRRAIQKLYTFKKEPSVKQMEKIVNKWKPYRTYAARILWRSLDFDS